MTFIKLNELYYRQNLSLWYSQYCCYCLFCEPTLFFWSYYGLIQVLQCLTEEESIKNFLLVLQCLFVF